MIKVYVSTTQRYRPLESTIEAVDELIKEGFIPMSPVMMYSNNAMYLPGHATWDMLNDEWLWFCDAYLSLKGSDSKEIEEARELDIPVFYNIEQLKEYFNDLD